jgi:hypothetical protein
MTGEAKETIELLDFMFDLGDATQAALADKKITWTDGPLFLSVAFKAPKALGGIESVPRELSEMSDQTREEVLSFTRRRFDLPDTDLEILIEETLAQCIDTFQLVKRWQKYKRA